MGGIGGEEQQEEEIERMGGIGGGEEQQEEEIERMGGIGREEQQEEGIERRGGIGREEQQEEGISIRREGIGGHRRLEERGEGEWGGISGKGGI